MKLYTNIFKVVIGLAFVLVLAISSYHQPNLAVASSSLYDSDAGSTSDVIAPMIYTVIDHLYILGPVTMLGDVEPIKEALNFEKLFDH